jgi:hypothetical protein
MPRLSLVAGVLFLVVLVATACEEEAENASSSPAPQAAAVTASPSPTRSPSPSAPPRATPSPSPRPTASPSPRPTPPPVPTQQPVPGPTFVVNTAPVGCHQDPTASARGVAQRSVGAVQAMDQLIRQADGTWHREVADRCWTRTEPGPVRLFQTVQEAERFAQSIRPTPPPPTPRPTLPPATPSPTAAGNCHPAYPTVCIPPPPPDLDCPQIPFRRFAVRPPDPHRFDADNDGVGCESG